MFGACASLSMYMYIVHVVRAKTFRLACANRCSPHHTLARLCRTVCGDCGNHHCTHTQRDFYHTMAHTFNQNASSRHSTQTKPPSPHASRRMSFLGLVISHSVFPAAGAAAHHNRHHHNHHVSTFHTRCIHATSRR